MSESSTHSNAKPGGHTKVATDSAITSMSRATDPHAGLATQPGHRLQLVSFFFLLLIEDILLITGELRGPPEEIQWKAPTPEKGDAKNWKGKRAVMKPEGSIYVGVRSAHRVHGKEKSLNVQIGGRW